MPPPLLLYLEVMTMTVQEAIAKADRLRPNTHEDADKVTWVNVVERHVVDHMNLHVGYDMTVPALTADDMDKALTLDGTDTELYVLYLAAMYDYYNGEFDRYNNGALQYNKRLEEWRAQFRREHMPKPFEGRRNLV